MLKVRGDLVRRAVGMDDSNRDYVPEENDDADATPSDSDGELCDFVPDITETESGPESNATIFDATLIEDDVPLASVVEDRPTYEAQIIDASIAPPAGADVDFIVAEVVDDPPTPAIRLGGKSSANYDHDARVRKFDRGGITAGAHPYRKRNRGTSILLASLGFLIVLGLFAMIKFAAEMPNREEYADTWQNADELYDDDDWRRSLFSDGTEVETDAERRQALREMYEEIERMQRELETNSAEEPPRIEDLEEAILADADWPGSALSELPLASDDEPLSSDPFHIDTHLTDYISTTQNASGDGLQARHTRIKSPHEGSRLIDVAWHANGELLFTLDATGHVCKVFVDPLNAVSTTRIENAVGIEMCQAGVIVATPSSLIVLDPATHSPKERYVGVACQEFSAGVNGHRVALAAFGKLTVLDLERNVVNHRIDRFTSRYLLNGAYQDSELAAEFESPVMWPDGKSLLALSNGRVCRFVLDDNVMELVDIGPQQGGVRSVALGSAEEGAGMFLFAPDQDAPGDHGEASWFAERATDRLFDTIKPQNRIVAAAICGVKDGPTYFLGADGRCSRYPARDDGTFANVQVFGPGETVGHRPSHCGMVAAPRHPRVAVFRDESLWIVEPSL
jgi:hypothetical protein